MSTAYSSIRLWLSASTQGHMLNSCSAYTADASIERFRMMLLIDQSVVDSILQLFDMHKVSNFYYTYRISIRKRRRSCLLLNCTINWAINSIY